jgi:hypothetical protein
VQLARGESVAEAIRQNRLKYWVPTSGTTSALHQRGTTDASWLVHEDHILHLLAPATMCSSSGTR